MASSVSQVVRVLNFPVLVAAGVALAYGAWAAVVDAAGPNRLIVPVQVDHVAKVEVFYDVGSGYRAEDSASEIAVPAEGLHEVSLPVPRVPLKGVRFDPLDSAGKFSIGQPRLETASGRFIAKFPLSAVQAANQIAEFRLDGKVWRGVTTPEANDPQLVFATGAPLRVGAPRLPWIEAGVFFAAMVWVWRTRRSGAEASV